jgi:hypothetical protein
MATVLLLSNVEHGTATRQFASAAAAPELTHALDLRGRDAIAAAETPGGDGFVAALYVPHHLLVVIRAQHPDAPRIREAIAAGRDHQVYQDLHDSANAAGKFFLYDAGADGILTALPGSGAVDVLIESGVRQTRFNGDPERQALTASQYDERLAAADAQYARLLRILASAARMR